MAESQTFDMASNSSKDSMDFEGFKTVKRTRSREKLNNSSSPSSKRMGPPSINTVFTTENPFSVLTSPAAGILDNILDGSLPQNNPLANSSRSDSSGGSNASKSLFKPNSTVKHSLGPKENSNISSEHPEMDIPQYASYVYMSLTDPELKLTKSISPFALKKEILALYGELFRLVDFILTQCTIVFFKLVTIAIMDNEKVYIIYDEDTNILDITLKFIDEELFINRGFNFQRKSSEKYCKFLTRINDNIVKAINRKLKKDNKVSELGVHLISKESNEIFEDTTLSCFHVFVTHADKYYLKIKNAKYTFCVNPPIVTSLELPKKNIMAGYFVYPVKLVGFNCDNSKTKFKWFRSKDKFQSVDKGTCSNLEWEEIGEGFRILISQDEISRLLKVVAIPYNGIQQGCSFECTSSVIVSPGPGCCPFEKRHTHTTKILHKDMLRVMSYNILADLYADSDYAKLKLYPNCPPYALEAEYRRQLLIKEILGYNGDLICLQEVDEKAFLYHLSPVFSSFGLEGEFKNKGRETVSEGLATFYRRDKLKLKEVLYFHLSEELQRNPLFIDILDKVEKKAALFESVTKRTTILQVCVFSRIDVPRTTLVVGNTHLYFEPSSDHIRFLQAGMCLTLLRQIMGLHKMEGEDVSLIFSGDFNSAPENAVYRLMTTQLVDEEDLDWRSKEGEEVEGVSFSHDLELGSACGIPEFTNFTVGYSGVLDYIFFQTDKFSVEQIVPFPSNEELTEHKALPSVTFPSDHIALVADLKWLNKK